MMVNKYSLLFFLFIFLYSCSQESASFKEEDESITTYPFSDPDPSPKPEENYYPYFRYSGFTNDSVKKNWKVVTLENDYVKFRIFPEIGGKIWGAIEKTTGKEFIYNNSVVKFRDIAQRGPWTSGGIEFDFGVIGHAPHVSTPVDYLVRKNEDGSVSCFIGGINLITRNRWETEVNLQPDKAYFTTNTIWNNYTPLVQPYYNWSNAAYQSKGNLEFVFPGKSRISHSGVASSWPIDKETDRNISFYNKNNFGGSKSYHIVGGALNGFYAAYWHDLNFGSGHYSVYGDKLGGKVFLWSLSRSGEIWKDLLTDTDGQYVEFQAGRLFNQAASGSTMTPYKHYGFSPHACDQFKEYWYPIMDIGGVLQSNKTGALNVIKNNEDQEICFSPLKLINDKIEIFFGNNLKYSFNVKLKPLEVWKKTIAKNPTDTPLKIIIGSNKDLVYNEDISYSTRPVKIADNFDWDSVYGLFTKGVEWIYQGKYDLAYSNLEDCLEKDPLYAPALNYLAELQLRKSYYKKALKNVKKSLSLNTYDPKANFVFGLISRKTGNLIDAQDGFAVASLSPEYRSASYIELAKLFIRKNDFQKAQGYVERVLTKDKDNQEATQLMSFILRQNGQKKLAEKYIDLLENIAPLNHFCRCERQFLNPGIRTTKSFTSFIKNELPYQTYMEMALWYQYLGDIEDAAKVLKLSPANALIDLQLSYLYKDIKDNKNSDSYFNKFLKDTVAFVFPFRQELITSLQWAISKTNNWKPKYYLGILHWSLGNKVQAIKLFNDCGNLPESPSFYLVKSNLFKDCSNYDAGNDLLKARNLGCSNWRTSLAVIDYYLKNKQVSKALDISKKSLKMFPSNNDLKYSYAKCLMANELYSNALNELENTYILPFEGARYGRTTYRQAAVMESLHLYKEHKFKESIINIEKARLWPENLGVGKPYNVDERIEDFLEAENLLRLNEKEKAFNSYKKVIRFSQKKLIGYRSTDFLYLIALKRLNMKVEIKNFMLSWQKKKPEDPLFKWSKSMLNNNRSASRLIEDKINTKTGGTPWDPQYADTEFELVKEIFRYISVN